MQVLLSHPVHGKAHAFDEQELQDFLKRGFVVEEPREEKSTFTAHHAQEPAKRRGRPPKAH